MSATLNFSGLGIPPGNGIPYDLAGELVSALDDLAGCPIDDAAMDILFDRMGEKAELLYKDDFAFAMGRTGTGVTAVFAFMDGLPDEDPDMGGLRLTADPSRSATIIIERMSAMDAYTKG